MFKDKFRARQDRKGASRELCAAGVVAPAIQKIPLKFYKVPNIVKSHPRQLDFRLKHEPSPLCVAATWSTNQTAVTAADVRRGPPRRIRLDKTLTPQRVPKFAIIPAAPPSQSYTMTIRAIIPKHPHGTMTNL